MFTMAPAAPRPTSLRATARQANIVPRVFTAKTRSHSSSSISSTGRFGKMPWAFTRTSIGPRSRSSASTAASTSAARDTSPATLADFPPVARIVFATSAPASARASKTPTAAPARASSVEIARPRRPAPPVTMATRPSSSPGIRWVVCELPEMASVKRERYDGYRSFQYLEPGVDYRPFDLAKEVARVPSRRVEVSADQEARVQRLLEANTVVSLHDHATVAPAKVAEMTEYRRQGREWTGYEGLSVSGLDCVFDALMGGTATITSRAGWKWDDVVYDLGMRLSDIAHSTIVVRAGSLEDIRAAKASGRIALVPCLETATPIENELDRLDILYGLGVRSVGIAYSEANALGSGLREERDAGLTEFGRLAVRRMNRLGIAIDLSHAGDQTSMDTIAYSEHPVFITHAGARALWNNKRMKPDQVLQACAQRGGVIGISAAAHTTLTERHPLHSIESVMEHFEYVANLVGIEHVAFGPDTFFGDHVGLHRFFARQFSLAASRGGLKFQEVEFVDGIENPGESFPNIVRC